MDYNINQPLFTTHLIEALHCDAGSRGSKSIREDNPILLSTLASVQYFFRGLGGERKSDYFVFNHLLKQWWFQVHVST